MRVNIARFYDRRRWELHCEIVTPMFLGGADQEAALRAAPFKGLLRYWWRVAHGRTYRDHQTLLAHENRIFGSPDEVSGGKSRVTVVVEAERGMQPSKDTFANPGDVPHPECERTKKKTNPLNYLAGMGLIHYKTGIQHSYFPAGGRFHVRVTAAADVADEVEAALGCLCRFGAMGSRSRNGWGCFTAGGAPRFTPILADWHEAMARDYPHCLGRDAQGALLWRTREDHPGWERCMRELAATYIRVRTQLNVVSGDPPDRHLLGYPVTNHPIQKPHWGNQGRHASALRLLVRRVDGGYRGYFLHLPHGFSREMWPGDRERQTAIWQRVHQQLDTLCHRVPDGEVR